MKQGNVEWTSEPTTMIDKIPLWCKDLPVKRQYKLKALHDMDERREHKKSEERSKIMKK